MNDRTLTRRWRSIRAADVGNRPTAILAACRRAAWLVMAVCVLAAGPCSAAPRAASQPVPRPNLTLAVADSIRALKLVPAPSLAIPAAPASPPSIQAAVIPDDATSWKLDYPMPGELALGRWRSAQTNAVGAVLTFPLPDP